MGNIERIRKISKDIYPGLAKLRAYFHQNPELSFKEFNTSKKIISELKSIGISFTANILGTGIIGLIEGAKTGPTIGIRAELDALPIDEKSFLEYASQTPGVMHACGHDIHMANLVGVAKVLKQLQSEIHGNILLIFQPGEELLPGGAKGMIESDFFQKHKPDSMLGMHILPELSMGKVGFRSGPYMASGDEIYITVKGRGGHAALPQLLIDPVLIASHVIVGLQQVVSRKNPGSIPTVLSFGKVIANGANNVIPDEVRIEGTFRTMDESWRQKAHQHIIRIAEGIATSMGGKCIVEIRRGYPSLSNNKKLTQFAFSKAIEYLGENNALELPIRLTTDDFAYYSAQIPSVYFRLGTGLEVEQLASLHSSKLVVDEKVLKHSVGLTAWLALQMLGYFQDTSINAEEVV